MKSVMHVVPERSASQHPASDAALLTHQSQQQVLCPNVCMAHALGFFLSQAEHASCALGEAFQFICHGNSSLTLYLHCIIDR